MSYKKTQIDIYKIVGTHPVLDVPVNLKWYRGASRYNNGATLYGRKYELRHLIAYSKHNPYTEQELKDWKARTAK